MTLFQYCIISNNKNQKAIGGKKMKESKKAGRRTLNANAVRKTAGERSERGGVSYLKLPEGVKMFKAEKAGLRRLDIMAYEVPKSSLQDPKIAVPGDLWYELTYYVHSGLGADGDDTIVCPKKMLGERCPLCETAAKKKARGDDWNDFKEFTPKRRQMFVVIDRKSPDLFQVMDAPYPMSGVYKSLGNLLDFKLKNMEDNDPRAMFSHPCEGMTVEVGFEEDSFNGHKFYKPISVDLVPRKEQYEESIIDELPALDDMLIIEDYAAIEKLMYAETDLDSNDDDEPAPRRAQKVEEKEEVPVRSRRAPAEEKEEETPAPRRSRQVEADREEEPAAEPAPRRRSAVPPISEDDDAGDEPAPRRGRAVEPDADEEAPAPTLRRRSRVEAESTDEEPVAPARGRRSAQPEDEEAPAPAPRGRGRAPVEPEDEEAPAPRRKVEEAPKKAAPKASGEECPFGHQFGEADEHKDCDKCDKWEECDKRYEELKKAKKK
jgi:hypothetical protein